LARHERTEAAFCQLALELFPYPLIFIHVLNLVFCAVFNFFRMTMKLHGRVERKVARRVTPGIEMLVEPLVRRHETTGFVPWHDHFLFAFFPHNRVAFADRNHDHAPRAVAVCFLV
jgi:hypothetical protein